MQTFCMGEDLPSDAERELKQAREGLADARLLIDQGGSVNGTANRLYYACFHAARAVLYDRGEYPRSHGASEPSLDNVSSLKETHQGKWGDY